MTELEYVLAHFEQRLASFRDKRIVIHGSREYARAILERFRSTWDFVGVMSGDPIEGAALCGVPVLPEEALASTDFDLLLLTERVKYAEAVYRRAAPVCEARGIALYDMYGVDELAAHRALSFCKGQNLYGWKKICRRYDIVAFEVMDTLFYRPEPNAPYAVREPFTELIPWLQERGIGVHCSLRKSHSEEEQLTLLRSFFPGAADQAIRREGEDLSFRALRETAPEQRILYIACGFGQGYASELILPRYYGIDTYRYEQKFYDHPSYLMPVAAQRAAEEPYDASLKERVLRKIEACDVVTFDVFDTLLLRRTLYPGDVYALTERRAKCGGLPAEGFASRRAAAERELVNPDLDEIYDSLQESFGWDADTRRAVMDVELAAEADVSLPRPVIAALLRHARSLGKRVWLISDMYLPSSVIADLLESNGVAGFERLLVSCECGRSKLGGLYEELLASCTGDEQIVHIGDDPLTDGAACEALGIDAVVLPSPLALAKARGWGDAVQAAGSLEERCLLGSAIAQVFSDPFQSPNLQEQPRAARLRRYALSVISPLAVGHMTWLLGRLREKEYAGVLFLSRDGWLPFRLYQSLPDLPPAVYFHANRRSSYLCCADDETTRGQVYDNGTDAQLSYPEIVQRVFGLPDEQLLQHEPGESFATYMRRYSPLLGEISERARKAYRRYACRCGLLPGKTYAVVDFIASGTTQLYLSRTLPCRLEGYYFGNYRPVQPEIPIAYYLRGEEETLLNNFIELESFFTAPEPAVDHIADDGRPVFADEIRSEGDLQELRSVLTLALEESTTFFRLFHTADAVIRPSLIEEMFAADRFHWVQRFAYNDWMKVPIKTKLWEDVGIADTLPSVAREAPKGDSDNV